MKFPVQATIFKGQLDMAGIAGVLFLLVLFMSLSSFLVFPPGVRLALPEASEMPGFAGPSVTVAMDSSGQIFFGNQVTAEDQLRSRLAEAARTAAEPLTLILQLDRSLGLESMVRLTSLARSVGIKEVVIGTAPPLLEGRKPASKK